MLRRRGAHRAILVAVSAAATACGSDDPITPLAPCDPPAIVRAGVTAVEGNVLAAVAGARVLRADSVAARSVAEGTATAAVTPAFLVADDSVEVPVLGLRPGTTYAVTIALWGPCGTIESAEMALTTGSLPADLPSYAAEGIDPSPGYVAFAAGNYGIVIDNTGRVVWYHRFENGVGLNFQAQPNGRYVARPPSPDPDAPWVEIDVLGHVTRTLGCADGLAPRFHDLIMEPDGSYWLMCDDRRVVDLSSEGGLANATVIGTAVQHLAATGERLFAWSPFDHFDLADLDPTLLLTPTVNWTHGNAIALDADGNLLISFRNLGEITKVDTRTGSVQWRFGGARNEFTLDGSGAPPFVGQHGVRIPRHGELLVLDNLGEPAGSRVERWALDEQAKTARIVTVFRPDGPVVAQLGGTTQPLPGGRTLVSYGSGGRVEEYDSAGRVVWRIAGSPGYVFRAQRIRSLYTPGADGVR
ncbi:MAG TPA: arylsulfotransferase family protein [Gemmatimonadaceae bacterium]